MAALARLKLNDEEVAGLQKDISNILEYVGQVSAVSSQGPTLDQGSSRSDLNMPLQRNVMRADTPRAAGEPMDGKEEALRDAFPKREGDFNVVRKIIQKDE